MPRKPDFEMIGFETVEVRRQFDFSMCRLHLNGGDSDVRAAAEKWAQECRRMGLDTLEGCTVAID